MNDERAQVELFTDAVEQGAIEDGGRGSAPHARAGGEDLEGIGAELVGFQRRLFQRALACSVDSDAQNSIVTGMGRAWPAGEQYN